MSHRHFLVVVVAGVMLAACGKTSPPVKLDTPKPFDLKRVDGARIQGSPNAKLWLVMASDFQCPFCRMFHGEAYTQILSEYVATGKVRVAFLNEANPAHSHALVAAEAAMCAGAQDRFWQMHDALFATQDRWASVPNVAPVFDSLATSLGLAMSEWHDCRATHATRNLIDNDRAKAQDAGSGSTPTFFLGDGRTMKIAVVGALPFADFKRAIDSALATVPPGGQTKTP